MVCGVVGVSRVVQVAGVQCLWTGGPIDREKGAEWWLGGGGFLIVDVDVVHIHVGEWDRW